MHFSLYLEYDNCCSGDVLILADMVTIMALTPRYHYLRTQELQDAQATSFSHIFACLPSRRDLVLKGCRSQDLSLAPATSTECRDDSVTFLGSYPTVTPAARRCKWSSVSCQDDRLIDWLRGGSFDLVLIRDCYEDCTMPRR